MSGRIPSRSAICGSSFPVALVGIGLFVLSTAGLTVAQVHGVPPSVTSIQFHVPPFLPNAMPSVTSLGPYGYGYRAGPIPPPFGIYPVRAAYGHGRRSAYGSYGYGGGYAVPYYVPVYDSSSGYDSGGGGPYLYSGPPTEQTLHIVVDLPRSKYAADPDGDDEAMALPAAPLQQREADATPLDATVLVFRDGHQQEVSNYAIMGQTLYIFDSHRQKIGLGDLDVPATIKLNDDRGVEFHLPKGTQS